jgi:hypothetical protein
LSMRHYSADEGFWWLILMLGNIVDDKCGGAVNNAAISFDMQFSVSAPKHFPDGFIAWVRSEDVIRSVAELTHM